MSISPELASGTMRYFERVMERVKITPLPGSLARVQISPEQVRAQLAASVPLTPEQVKRAMARQVKKGSCGRGGLPDYVVNTMYADYLRLKSLAKVGALYGRTRQAIYCVFSERGLALTEKKFQRKRQYKGRCYTPGKNGYYRATSGDRVPLHHQIWVDNFGPVPDGHQVSFKDADHTNFQISNLLCLPVREVTLYHHARHQRAAHRPEAQQRRVSA